MSDDREQVNQSATYILAGGGTGGHLYPGLAVAEQLAQLDAGCRIVFACSNRPIDARILDGRGHHVVPQPVVPMPRRVRGWLGFLRAWRDSQRLAARLVRDLKPAAVLGLGGFAAGPVVTAAARAGVSAGLLNPDAVPGRANRYLARSSEAIFTQFAATAEAFPPAHRAKVRCVGCPVRGSLAGASRDEAIAHFGLRGDRQTLLVLGGSLGAASINEAVGRLAGELAGFAHDWQVLHVTGPAKSAVAPAGGEGAILHRTLEYCDRMDLAYAAADLAICRGGAATIAELSATGTPAIILPYPHHRDRQQYLNAQALVAAGAGRVMEDTIDAERNAAALRELLADLLSCGVGVSSRQEDSGPADAGNPGLRPHRQDARAAALKAMRGAAEGLGGRGAAAVVARWMIQRGGKK